MIISGTKNLFFILCASYFTIPIENFSERYRTQLAKLIKKFFIDQENRLFETVCNFQRLSCVSDISPPKKVLKAEETLLDIGAIPGINLYFGLDQVDTPGNQFLKAEYSSNAVSSKIALEVANYFRYSTLMIAVLFHPLAGFLLEHFQFYL